MIVSSDSPAPRTVSSEDDLERLTGLLAAAQFPVVFAEYAGADLDTYNALLAFCDANAVPVIETRSAAFANFPKDHPMYAGGDPNMVLADTDLAILVRCRAPWYPPSNRPYRLIEDLEAKGAKVDFYDPHVPSIPRTREHGPLAGRQSIHWYTRSIADYDAALVCTDHDAVDYNALAAASRLIVAYGRDVVLRVARSHARAAPGAAVEIDGHAPLRHV